MSIIYIRPTYTLTADRISASSTSFPSVSASLSCLSSRSSPPLLLTLPNCPFPCISAANASNDPDVDCEDRLRDVPNCLEVMDSLAKEADSSSWSDTRVGVVDREVVGVRSIVELAVELVDTEESDRVCVIDGRDRRGGTGPVMLGLGRGVGAMYEDEAAHWTKG